MKKPISVPPPEEEEQHPWSEMLAVLSAEDLIRLKHRLQKKGKKKVIALLEAEIQRKENEDQE